jgi:two-component system, NarL family, nitrate/nitrite response regulator NarL
MKKIKILMVDDHQLIMDGLISLLKSREDMLVAGMANNGREALQMLKIVEPDLVLMDIDMPVMNGIEALREIKQTSPSTRVIILSMHEEAGMIKNLVALGADGYLLKSCSQEELLRAIDSVAQGQPCFSHGVTLSLLNAKDTGMPSSFQQTEALSERETEVIRLIAAGFSNKEIGSKLFISHRTVDTHRTNLMKKLNVSNIAGLISYAIKKGLV